MSIADPCVLNWSKQDVHAWLKKKGFCEDICENFQDNDIDGKSVLLLNENDVKTICHQEEVRARGTRVRGGRG